MKYFYYIFLQLLIVCQVLKSSEGYAQEVSISNFIEQLSKRNKNHCDQMISNKVRQITDKYSFKLRYEGCCKRIVSIGESNFFINEELIKKQYISANDSTYLDFFEDSLEEIIIHKKTYLTFLFNRSFMFDGQNESYKCYFDVSDPNNISFYIFPSVIATGDFNCDNDLDILTQKDSGEIVCYSLTENSQALLQDKYLIVNKKYIHGDAYYFIDIKKSKWFFKIDK